MNILTRKREFLQSLTLCIPVKVSKLFVFGCVTLVAQDIRSTRANARRANLRWFTAKSKMWRLLANKRIASTFPSIVMRLSLVSKEDVVAVDFSDFGNGRQVLMFARQTRRGRALPLYFEIIEYPIEHNSQNLFVIAAIKRFFTAARCTPTLVFDRGFACPSIIRFLAQHKYKFIIRIKKRKFLAGRKGGRVRAAEAFRANDCSVYAWGCSLRLIRSDDPGNGNDPWYLVTNDVRLTRDVIIRRYYYRFEIEEFFRDCKRLLGFEYLHFKTTQSLSVALWFSLLTTWFFENVAEKLTALQENERKLWRVSRFRYVYETLLHETLLAYSAAQAPPATV